MADKVSQQDLLKTVKYNGGKLYWLERGNKTFDKSLAGQEVGCSRPDGYRTMQCCGNAILVHRAVWIIHHGTIPDGYEIDHINNNPIDNRIENLRLASRIENSYNKSMQRNNTSGVKGVSWNKNNNNWRAKIIVNKKKIEVGSFPSKEEAEMAVKRAREIYHGQYANIGYKEAA